MKKTLAALIVAVLLFSTLCILPAHALSYIYDIGEDVWVVIAGSKGADDPISRLYDVQGLPSGLSLNVVNGWQIALQGKAKQSGTYPFTYSFITGVKGEEHIAVSDTVVINAPPIEITKYPGSETVTEHASALFVAAATNYSRAEWSIIDSEDNAYVGPEAMTGLFPELTAEAFKGEDGREYLRLINIPLEMNQYRVVAEFYNLDNSGSVSTPLYECAVFVQERKTAAPVINSQPVGAELNMGTAIRLELEAACAEGQISYQWYRNLMESSENGIAISGANTNYYVPEKTEGTVYYYCVLWASADGKTSETIYSDIVKVTYVSDEPKPSPQTVTSEEKDLSGLVTAGIDDAENEKTGILADLMKMKKSDLIAIVGVGALLLVSGTVMLLLNRRENR